MFDSPKSPSSNNFWKFDRNAPRRGHAGLESVERGARALVIRTFPLKDKPANFLRKTSLNTP